MLHNEKILAILTHPRTLRIATIGLALGCAAVCFFLISNLFRKEQLIELRFSAGPTATRRFEIATYLHDQASRNLLKLRGVTSSGSVDSLKMLRDGQIDLALVDSGVSLENDDNIEVIAALGLEPFHILVRGEIAPGTLLKHWLKNKRVGIGGPGTTDYLFAMEVIDFEGISVATPSSPGDVHLVEYNKNELLSFAKKIIATEGPKKAELIEQLPECIVLHGSLPSPIVQSLVDAANYKIAPAKAAEAFKLDTLQLSNRREAKLERQFLEATSIPMHTYRAENPVPEQGCPTIGARTLVVTRRGVGLVAVTRLMRTLFEGEFASRMQTRTAREISTPYQIHPAAVAYMDRDKPIAVDQIMEVVNQLLSVLGAMSAGALSLYGILWRGKAKKPIDYFSELRKLEMLAHSESAEDGLREQQVLARIESRLAELRQDLVEDVCTGRVSSDQTVANILALMQDYRTSLPKSRNADMRELHVQDSPNRLSKWAA